MTDAEFKRRSGSSHQTIKLMNDKTKESAPLLHEAFLKAVDSVKGVDDSLLSKAKNCETDSQYRDLIELVEYRTNGALLAEDEGEQIATNSDKEFGHIELSQTSWSETDRHYLATPWPVSDIPAQRKIIDEALASLNLYQLTKPTLEKSAERNFILKNMELLGSTTNWSAETPEIAANNAKALKVLRNGLNSFAKDDDLSVGRSGDLDSLIARSTEIVEIKQLLENDTFFKDFKLMYAPLVVRGGLDLELIERDWGEPQGEYKYTQKHLHLDLTLYRVIHCLVITEPCTKALIVTAQYNYPLRIRATRDLAWDQEYYRVNEPDSGYLLQGTDELLTSIAERNQ